MPLAQDNCLRFATWLLVAVLLLTCVQGVMACNGLDKHPMGEDVDMEMATGEDPHCQTLSMTAYCPHDCEQGCFNLQQVPSQRDTDLLNSYRLDQPAWVLKSLSVLLPVRGPPRDEFNFPSIASTVSIPPRLKFCCLRI